ncbi:MAG TPA: hypothetical protein VFB73_16800 [Chloroflexota bacterium]|nr:hypothetical protein [Chloroflexota bacterium]
MQPRTRLHLDRAEQNRALIQAWLAVRSSEAPAPEPGCWVWGVVIAFYAALHFADAYLGEHHGFQPRDHHQRREALRQARAFQTPDAQGITPYQAYRTLENLATHARYAPDFTATRDQVHALLHGPLEHVWQAVYAALAASPTLTPRYPPAAVHPPKARVCRVPSAAEAP